MHIMGGSDDDFEYLSSTLLLRDNIIQPGSDLPFAVDGHCIVSINSTHFFFGGGYDGKYRAETYLVKIETWTWTEIPSMSVGRNLHSCGMVKGRGGTRIVVAGGELSTEAASTSEILALNSLKWTPGPGVPGAPGGSNKFDYSQVAQMEETFLVVGGSDGQDLKTIYEFDLNTSTWKLRSESLVTARSLYALVAIPDGVLEC